MSSDGQYLAVTVMNGSNAPKSSPLFNDFGRLRIYGVSNRTLVPIAEARIGHWCQGTAWSRDSRTVLAQCMVETGDPGLPVRRQAAVPGRIHIKVNCAVLRGMRAAGRR